MMQSCASAAKLRSGGPILPVGTKAKGHAGIPPPRTVIGASSQADGRDRNCGGAFSVLHSLCRTQNNAVWYNALPHKPPQGDQQLARQGHDHRLSSTASVLGASSKPPRQGAVLLVQKEPPRQLNHASSDSSIARTGQSFLSTFPPALVGRASEAGITRYGPSVAHVSRQHLVRWAVRKHKKGPGIRTAEHEYNMTALINENRWVPLRYSSQFTTDAPYILAFVLPDGLGSSLLKGNNFNALRDLGSGIAQHLFTVAAGDASPARAYDQTLPDTVTVAQAIGQLSGIAFISPQAKFAVVHLNDQPVHKLSIEEATRLARAWKVTVHPRLPVKRESKARWLCRLLPCGLFRR